MMILSRCFKAYWMFCMEHNPDDWRQGKNESNKINPARSSGSNSENAT
jgi:hypothetical protein